MTWIDTPDEEPTISSEMLDLVFPIAGGRLPVDHAHALAEAVTRVLPWLAECPDAGIHPLSVAAPGNGWTPPGAAESLLILSRRTRLRLRLPATRARAAESLRGASLDVVGHALTIGAPRVHPLRATETLYARHLIDSRTADEPRFVAASETALRALGIEVRKLVCGRQRRIDTPRGGLHTRSLLLADLRPAESLRLQAQGLGPHRLLGCGLFVAHKSIAPVAGYG